MSNTFRIPHDVAVEEKPLRLVRPLLALAKSSRAFNALLLVEIGLHPGQDQLLHALQPGDSISVSALADQLAVRPSTVSKMLDRLIEKDLVRRSANSRDARRTMVTLTPSGETYRDKVTAIWARLERELVAQLPEAETERMAAALGAVDDLLVAKLRRLR